MTEIRQDTILTQQLHMLGNILHNGSQVLFSTTSEK